MTTEHYGLHWFRRDLRIEDNAALKWSSEEYSGRVLGFFCFDSVFLSRSDFSATRFAFFLNTLKKLKEELQQKGGDLLVLDVGPQEAFERLRSELVKNKISLPKTISFSRDYEPFAVQRDRLMKNLFSEMGIEAKTFRDHLVLEPEENLKDDKSYYQVYTPFSKRWLQTAKSNDFQNRFSKLKSFSFSLTWSKLFRNKLPLKDRLEEYCEKNTHHVNISIPQAGSAAALKVLSDFERRLSNYTLDRDRPGVNGTSHLSIYLKNGSITTAQIIRKLKLFDSPEATSGKAKYLNELIWREFYYHILYNNPRVEKEPFQLRWKNLKWSHSEKYFKAWCEGKTGYPIVDAGMRQLNQTGWMHNRVRMIVASFLTKDLLVDYKMGENYFMKALLDGDLAPNNGGWQWAASTGCDPQPYFRIFNPVLQSQKFDPQGEYIKKFVPELRDLSEKEIHQPQKPIVDHSIQRDLALKMFKAAL